MKIITHSEDVERIGETEETTFKINANARAFKILSSNLYKDKIGSIVREISTNAYDAHILMGTPERPFDVTLPTAMDPVFKVRDYGPGLSKTDMLTIYQSYFTSTKNDSNDYIGGLGLGGKSPFSYTRFFTVISRCGGMRTTYDAVINATGLPSIAVRFACEMEEGEETGLEVIVPVINQSDISTFAAKISRTYAYYDVHPNVTGQYEKKDWKNRPIAYDEAGDYTIYQSGTTHPHGHGPVAIMGVVSYPIDIHSLSAEESPTTLRQIFADDPSKFFETASAKQTATSPLDGLRGVNLEVEFEVGELDITPGREDLSYDEKTRAALNKRLMKIVTEARDKVQALFTACKTMRDAKILYDRQFSYNRIARGPTIPLSLIKGYEPTFKGKKVTPTYTLDLQTIPGIVVTQFSTSPHEHLAFTATPKDVYNLVPKANWDTGFKRLTPIKGAIALFYLDDPSRYQSKVRHHWAENVNTLYHSFVIHSTDPAIIKMVETQLETKASPVSSLKSPPRAERVVSRKISVREISQHRRTPALALLMKNTHCPTSWHDCKVDIESTDEKLYVVTDHNRILKDGAVIDEHFPHVYAFLLARGDLNADRPVYALAKSQAKSILGNGNWIDFWDFYKSTMALALAADPSLWKVMTAAHSLTEFKGRTSTATTSFVNALSELHADLPETHIVSRVYEPWKTMREQKACRIERTVSSYNSVDHKAILNSIFVTHGKPTDVRPGEIKLRYTDAFRAYPLLERVYSSGQCPSRHILEYIKLLDEKRSAIVLSPPPLVPEMT